MAPPATAPPDLTAPEARALLKLARRQLSTLDARKLAVSDETYAVLDLLQSRHGWSNRQLGLRLGRSVAGVRVRLIDFRARNATPGARRRRRPAAVAGRDEQGLVDLAAELLGSLDRRTQELSDETWRLVHELQVAEGKSYKQLGPLVGWSVEGVRQRLTDYRARHGITFEPQVGGRPATS